MPRDRVLLTGNTVIDAVLWRNKARAADAKRVESARKFLQDHGILDTVDRCGEDLGFMKQKGERAGLKGATVCRIVLLTCHRRENLGAPAKRIFSAINSLITAAASPDGLRERDSGRKIDLHFVYPVHPNALGEQARKAFAGVPNMHLTPPMEFDQLAYVMERSHFVLTDSGGLQEESSVYRKPVLVLRESTERPEGIMDGVSALTGANETLVLSWSRRLLTDAEVWTSMSREAFPYGNGTASDTIVTFLEGRRAELIAFRERREEWSVATELRPGRVIDV